MNDMLHIKHFHLTNLTPFTINLRYEILYNQTHIEKMYRERCFLMLKMLKLLIHTYDQKREALYRPDMGLYMVSLS